MLQDHKYGSSASCGVAVYAPAFAGTKLYGWVTRKRGCEHVYVVAGQCDSSELTVNHRLTNLTS